MLKEHAYKIIKFLGSIINVQTEDLDAARDEEWPKTKPSWWELLTLPFSDIPEGWNKPPGLSSEPLTVDELDKLLHDYQKLEREHEDIKKWQRKEPVVKQSDDSVTFGQTTVSVAKEIEDHKPDPVLQGNRLKEGKFTYDDIVKDTKEYYDSLVDMHASALRVGAQNPDPFCQVCMKVFDGIVRVRGTVGCEFGHTVCKQCAENNKTLKSCPVCVKQNAREPSNVSDRGWQRTQLRL